MIKHSIQLAIVQKGGFQVDTLLFQTYIHFQLVVQLISSY